MQRAFRFERRATDSAPLIPLLPVACIKTTAWTFPWRAFGGSTQRRECPLRVLSRHCPGLCRVRVAQTQASSGRAAGRPSLAPLCHHLPRCIPVIYTRASLPCGAALGTPLPSPSPGQLLVKIFQGTKVLGRHSKCARHVLAAAMAEELDRNQQVYIAKLAEQAERYDDMVKVRLSRTAREPALSPSERGGKRYTERSLSPPASPLPSQPPPCPYLRALAALAGPRPPRVRARGRRPTMPCAGSAPSRGLEERFCSRALGLGRCRAPWGTALGNACRRSVVRARTQSARGRTRGERERARRAWVSRCNACLRRVRAGASQSNSPLSGPLVRLSAAACKAHEARPAM